MVHERSAGPILSHGASPLLFLATLPPTQEYSRLIGTSPMFQLAEMSISVVGLQKDYPGCVSEKEKMSSEV